MSPEPQAEALSPAASPPPERQAASRFADAEPQAEAMSPAASPPPERGATDRFANAESKAEAMSPAASRPPEGRTPGRFANAEPQAELLSPAASPPPERRAAGGFTGILNVNKPTGWTSHDVVARVRRLAGQKRVGHAGTLDPMAEGVLPVLLGRATRLADFIQLGRKTYVATVQLGAATDTDDTEGRVIAESPVPRLSSALLEEALGTFRGDILQTPPHYSALKVAGRRAYAIARGGGQVDLAARPVTIHDLRLLDWSENVLSLEVNCSKGTYIRALARDLSIALGTVGHLAALVRSRVGPFDLSDALTPDELGARGIGSALLPSGLALPGAPTYSANADEAARLANGQAVPVDGLQAESVWVYDPSGLLVCLASANAGQLRPRLAL